MILWMPSGQLDVLGHERQVILMIEYARGRVHTAVTARTGGRFIVRQGDMVALVARGRIAQAFLMFGVGEFGF